MFTSGFLDVESAVPKGGHGTDWAVFMFFAKKEDGMILKKFIGEIMKELGFITHEQLSEKTKGDF